MRPSQLPIPRIRLARRALRPPNTRTFETSTPRPFSQKNPRLLLLSQPSPRAQLPFLNPSSPWPPSGQPQLVRLISISANQKRFFKETARQTVKWTILIFITSNCFMLAGMGFLSERQERAFPSPHEWSLYTRFRFRAAKWQQVPENNKDLGFPNYFHVYNEFEVALARLEDTSKDGVGLVEQEGDVPGVGKAGFDLSAKSEEWREGYYEVLMGMGQAAERLDGWRTNAKRNHAWSPEFIKSESNPRPKMPPPGQPPAPPIEEQMPPADPPENFYLKILTTKGFNTYQRLTAALAYGDYLSYKKLPDSAEEMYRWGLDIAVSGLPTPDASEAINLQTAVLSSTAPKDTLTPNLVFAATSLASHFASTGNISAALPIYVSVLRARLSADLAPHTPPTPPPDSSIVGTMLSILMLQEPVYPPLPPTGDEPLLRREEDLCDEAALKNYIGEILFASAGSSPATRQQGLNWIREAVSNAKTGQSMEAIRTNRERKKKCETCEEVGLENWGKIMTYLAAEAREEREVAKGWSFKGLIWKLWGTGELEKKIEDLEGEEEGVVMRLGKLRSRMLREEWDELDKRYNRIFAF
ncbi:hypothetical protein BDV96DRAFT_584338 [Lophiotrema nucula]|uniref:MFS maltose permease n=1 Tax=Lophiotrema nucula TaxID=690887 RepID=A0A6A5YU92_9PLEO|nr:hypothetical protein BDV96DRAFT_584338 [Lophiotrema nucula]